MKSKIHYFNEGKFLLDFER